MDFQTDKISDMKQYLTDEFSMEPDEVIEMLDIFFESMEELNAAAESQLAESAIDKLGATGHAIKGSSANINATGISALGLKLENAGKNNNPEECREAVEALKNATALLKSEYEQ